MLRRLLPGLLSLLVLGLLAWWLVAPEVRPEEIGPGTRVIARSGVSVALVGDEDGRWRSVSLDEEDPLAVLVIENASGPPALLADGGILALVPAGLVLSRAGRLAPVEHAEPLPDGLDPSDALLVGVDARDRPVLRAAGDDGERLFVRAGDAWLLLADAQGPARPEPGENIVLAPAGRTALAFRGADGWEAWTWTPDGGVTRALARDCRRERALFDPSGAALVVDGKTAGIYRLDLDSGRLAFMGDGNLGHTPRVPYSSGYRGDPVLLVHPQFDLHGSLQIAQTHLTGGGRYQFTTGAVHHYLPAIAPGGRFLSYVQAAFDTEGRDPFEEEIYVFDFDRGRSPALSLGVRPAGRPDQGPVWAGDASRPVLLFVREDRVYRFVPPDPADPSKES